ncbi:transcriptional attenuator, LytR family [Paenibacillus uliginis N3/975]|uniref:Transcriptional attenuator, LytR family n=1 Tax=Paenibacillus uliginis N3/975 TaxID=1313296 RepID=A0A1X7HMN8_9BACL|nr:LCP family protein [Paenibacillus uliginis]SMF88456.1 transcriptional attenuator, LytR family [Paenibacillus uliginis N3/975]
MSSGQSNLPPRAKSGGQSKKKPPPKKKSGVKSFFKIILILVLLAVLGVAVYAGSLYLKVENGILDTGNNEKVAPEQSAKVKPITMLLLGTDHRPETGTHLTDVVMVVSMHPETNSATLISLPRDTSLQLEGYKSNQKLNAFYPIFKTQEKKSGILAEDQMKTMLGKYLDVDIDYVTVLDFQGFRDVVNALGGVNVDVKYNMCHRDSVDGTDINLKVGPQELDGKQALDYVRYRKSMNCKPKTKESNDFDRNARQSEVLHSLIDRMKSFGGATKAFNVLDAVDDNMKTDLEKDQVKNMIMAYYDIKKEDVKFVPLTGEWRSPFVYISDSELTKAKQALKDELAGKHTREPEGTNTESASKP